MPIKSDGIKLARRYHEALEGIIGAMLEMQVGAPDIKTMFESCLKDAQKKYSEDHGEEIANAVFDELLKKK